MASPKASSDEILYMDELHHHPPPPSSATDSGVGVEPAVSSATSIALAEAKPEPPHRHLETDNANNKHPAHPDADEELDPELYHHHHHHRHRRHQPGVDDDLLPGDDEPPSSMRPASPWQKPNMPGMFSSGPPDVNVYQQKKTIAQGMMDLALISANANQFRYVLQSSGRHPYFYPSLAMIGASLLLQVIVGVGLIWNSRYNVKHEDQMLKANRANNWTVMAIFLVTILNVFISSFGVVESEAKFPANSKSD